MGISKNVFSKLVLPMMAVASLVGCSSGDPSFSLLEEKNSFSQIPQTINGKIDVLWVIDNSGSMATSQQNVASNFASFIRKFNEKGFDYRIAVTTTDAYQAVTRTPAANYATWAKFRDGLREGTGTAANHSGVYIITPDTPNVEQVFLTNIKQGTSGDGHERGLESLRAALAHEINDEFQFPREDAFMAVIIVSDEEDSIAQSPKTPVQEYVDFLDGLTKSSNLSRNYNVSTIAVLDQACASQLNSGQSVGNRYIDIANLTGGTIGSICSEFGPTMAEISNRIIQLSTRFPLNREPKVDTIRVTVDGVSVPQSTTDGWAYDEGTNSIVFTGSTYVPDAGSKISVTFDPATIK